MVEAEHVLDGGTAMTTYYVEVHYRVRDADRETLDHHADKMLDVIGDEHGLIDPDLGLNYKKRTVDVCTMVEADNEGDALNRALTGVRSAVHRVGDATAGWERTADELMVGTVRLADMADV
jgi:hypothetical protein